MVNFDTDCFFVSQLKKGYMLEKTGADTFQVVKTGYPYPDTPLPSQDMVTKLTHWLGIDRWVSVAELASYFDSVYDTETLMLFKSELKSIIENKSIGVLGSCAGFSTFFHCQFFSIYYIDNLSNSPAFDYIEQQQGLHFSYSTENNSGFILHFHKNKQEVRLGVGSSADEADLKRFSHAFERVFLLPPDIMSSYLDTLYSVLPILKFPVGILNPYSKVEAFVFKEVKPFLAGNLHRTLTFLGSSIVSMFGLDTLCYKSKTLLVSPVKATLESIWGYNVFCDLTMPVELLRFEFFNIGLLCSIYSSTESSSLRNEYKNRLKSFIDSTSRMLLPEGHFNQSVEIIDGNVFVLCSPYFWWCLENFDNFPTDQGLILRGSENKSLLRSAEFADCYSEDLGGVLRGQVSPFENKLFQHFLVSYSILGKDVLRGQRLGHTKASLHNVLKTFIPAFDRKVLLGGIVVANYEELFWRRYNIFLPDIKVLPLTLDNALDETSVFEDYEKSFIGIIQYLRHAVMSVSEDDFTVVFTLCDEVYFHKLSESYVPQFSTEQLDKFSTVFKMCALALLYNREVDLRVLLQDYNYNFRYSEGSFYIDFKRV